MSRRRAPAALAMLLLAACSSGGFSGRWESTFGGVTLDVRSDHTVAITVAGLPSEGTWESAGKSRIIVHGPGQDLTLTRTEKGELSDGLGGRFVRQK